MALLSSVVTWANRSRQWPRVASWLLAVAILFVASIAQAAWSPPHLDGHVVDEAHALSPSQAQALDAKLERVRQQTGFAIVVYLQSHLPEGMPIDDVAYTAFNTWGVGSKDNDDGVLLIAALDDHKLRIETGKGVGGALTDLESSHINRNLIGPLLRQGRVYDALDQGTDAIAHALVEGTPDGQSAGGRGPAAARAPRPLTIADYLKFGVMGLLLIGVVVLAIVSPAFRELLFFLLLFGRGGGGGGGFGGGGGGSGYGGGGGRSGGGGSSDDY